MDRRFFLILSILVIGCYAVPIENPESSLEWKASEHITHGNPSSPSKFTKQSSDSDEEIVSGKPVRVSQLGFERLADDLPKFPEPIVDVKKIPILKSSAEHDIEQVDLEKSVELMSEPENASKQLDPDQSASVISKVEEFSSELAAVTKEVSDSIKRLAGDPEPSGHIMFAVKETNHESHTKPKEHLSESKIESREISSESEEVDE